MVKAIRPECKACSACIKLESIEINRISTALFLLTHYTNNFSVVRSIDVITSGSKNLRVPCRLVSHEASCCDQLTKGPDVVKLECSW